MSTQVSEVDELVPPQQVVEYTFGLDGHLHFVQRPLSFFGKMELFAILAAAIEEALNSGVSMDEIFSDSPDDADAFVKAILKLVQFAPEFVKDLCVISLGVPKGEREYIKGVMELPEEEGGLSDDQGMQILETFADQNWEILKDFFSERIVPLVSRFTTQQDQASPSSKPSKATQQRTRKG